jgi:hypothetical protein
MRLYFVAFAGIGIALCTAFVLAPVATTEERVVIFGRSFNVANPSAHEHQAGYLQQAGLTTLNIKRMDADGESLAAMVSHALGEGNALESHLLSSRFIQLLALFSYQTKEDFEVERQNIVGMSICYLEKETPYLALYEHVAGKMVAIPQYHLEVNGALEIDDLRLLHFSFAESAETIPTSSEITLVRNEVIAPELSGKLMDDRLKIQLLTDSDRNAGRFTSPYFMGRSFFEGTDLGLGDLVIPSEQIHYLRDEVLMKSTRGLEYIRGMYRFGSLQKKTPDLLVNYAGLIPQVVRITEVLRHGNGSTTVIDESTAQIIIEIIGRHRDIHNPNFQEFLDLLETDTEVLAGKTKSDLLAFLKQNK